MFEVILQKIPKFVVLFPRYLLPGLQVKFINTLYCLYHRFSIIPKFKGRNNSDMYSFVNQMYKIYPDVDVNDF